MADRYNYNVLLLVVVSLSKVLIKLTLCRSFMHYGYLTRLRCLVKRLWPSVCPRSAHHLSLITAAGGSTRCPVTDQNCPAPRRIGRPAAFMLITYLFLLCTKPIALGRLLKSQLKLVNHSANLQIYL